MSKKIKELLEQNKSTNKANKELPQKLREPKDSNGTIKTGNIDAVVISDKKSLKVYTEETSDKAYRILIEKMNEGAVTLNEDGTILYCNSYFANMLKLPLQKVIGKEFKSFIDSSSKNGFVSLLKQSMEKGIKEEVYIHTSDGNVIPVLMSVNTFLLDDIFVSGIVLTDLTIQNKNQAELKRASDKLSEKAGLLQLQDKQLKVVNDDLEALNQGLEKRVAERTSELEKLNDVLKNLNLSKDKFLSVISHDLRNPLTALLISSNLLTSKAQEQIYTEIKPLVGIIDRNSRNILQQLNELVQWAKTQEEKIILNPEKINLVHGIDQDLELLKDIATQKNIVLENKVPFDINVNANSIMLRSIIQNLVTNAIKYTPQNGLITITAQSMDKMVEVCIADSGIGMAAGIKRKLFTNTDSISLPGTNNEQGTGLGLTLVKDFVIQNGGTIRVESKPGKGTSVFFTLPEDD